MLEVALQFKDAFDLLKMIDKQFCIELIKDSGVPLEEDWKFARLVLPFFKMFYDSTLQICGSSYVTCNMHMKEVFSIGKKIRHNFESSDKSIKLMAKRMKSRYDKY